MRTKVPCEACQSLGYFSYETPQGVWTTAPCPTCANHYGWKLGDAVMAPTGEVSHIEAIAANEAWLRLPSGIHMTSRLNDLKAPAKAWEVGDSVRFENSRGQYRGVLSDGKTAIIEYESGAFTGWPVVDLRPAAEVEE